ncbi:DUF3159 domain-containing protein [Chloroflexota bacterium]
MPEKEVNPGKFQELIAELRSVMSGRGGWIDSVIPPVIFLIFNALTNFEIALWGSLGTALLIAGYRLFKRQAVRYAMGGIGGVLLAILIARLLGEAQGFFLPGIVTGVFTVFLCFVSVLIKRPMVAWTSYLTRRWPLDWYWHKRVRPAYTEVTLVWGVFFTTRTLIQYWLFQEGETSTLGIVQLISGWPALILLLVASYLYGQWRLGNLKGPSVEEFKSGSEPPWQGQTRGY